MGRLEARFWNSWDSYQGRHTHMGAMGPTHGRQRRGAPAEGLKIFFCFFQFFSSVPAPVWASRKFLKLFLDFISIFKILNLKRAPKILLCAFFIVIRLLNKLTVVFRNRLLLSFL